MKKLYNLWLIACLVCLLSGCVAGQPDSTEGPSRGPTWQEQYDLGVRYLSEGNYQEAIIAFTAAIEIDPKRAPAYVGRGDTYVLSGETEDNLAAAKADYETAIELDETSTEAYLGLADVYIRQGDAEAALTILQEGSEKIRDNQALADKIAEIDKELEIKPGVAMPFSQFDVDNLVSEEEFTIGGIPFYKLAANEVKGLLPQFDDDDFIESDDGYKSYRVMWRDESSEESHYYVVISCDQFSSSYTLDYVQYANFNGYVPTEIPTEVRGISIGNSIEDVFKKIGLPLLRSKALIESGLSVTIGADSSIEGGYGWLALHENMGSSDGKDCRVLEILTGRCICRMSFIQKQLVSVAFQRNAHNN